MYDFYIKNALNSQGSIDSTEHKLYSVPISDSDKNRVLIDPTIKTEMGKTGSLDFSIRPNFIYYNRFQQMKTIMRVVFDGTTIFRGRTLTIDDSHFTGERKIHLEGDMAFLMDSQQPGIKEEDRATISIFQHLTNVINEHNRQMRENGEEDKVFYLGEVPGQYSLSSASQRISVANDKFGSESWRKTYDEIEDLRKKHGGYFRTRYENDGKCYLDWLKNSFTASINENQPIQVTSNMIDINSTTEVNNIFTVVIPIGDNNGAPLYVEGYTPPGHSKRTTKTISVPEIVNFYTKSELDTGFHLQSEYASAITRYGTIYRTQSFSNAKTQDVLWSYALDWIKNNYVGGIRSFTVSALDLHHIDPSKVKYLTGDLVRTIFPVNGDNAASTTETKVLTVLSAQHKPHTPDKNNYSIGVPSDLLSREYGSKSKKSTKKRTYKPDHNGNKNTGNEDEVYTAIDEYKQLANDYIVNNRYNNDIYAQLMAEDPKKAERAVTSTVIAITEGFLAADGRPTSGHHKKRVQKIMMDGVQGSLTINGPVDHSHDLTDEQVALLNERNKFAIFDATKQEFGLKAAIESTTDIGKLTAPVPTLMQMKLKNGLNGKSGALDIWGENKNTNPNAAQTIGLSGMSGSMNAVMSKLGLDGTGNTGTIFQNGLNSIVSMVDPSKAGSADTENINVEITGGSDGEIGVGKESDGSGGKKWQITLNKPITYTGKDGKTYTVPSGTVGSKDFYLDEVPSFKTELAVINTALIGVAHISDLTAINAFIENLQSEKAVVTNISAVTSRAGTFRGDEYILNVTGSSTLPSGAKYLRDSLGGCLVYPGRGQKSENDEVGKIYFKFSKIDGSDGPVVNFSIADTQTYKDAVSAAWDNGGKTAYLKYSGSLDLNPGGSVQIFAYYKDHNNTADCTPSGSPNYVKVTAKDTRAANWNAGGQTAYANVDKASLSPGGKSTITVYYTNYSGAAASTGRTYYVTANTDSNLTAGNIKKDVTIFGVKGTYSGGGGAAGSTVDLYPNGDSDITITTNQPTGSTALGKLATKLNAANKYQWVNFYAVVKDSSGNVVSGSRKLYAVRQLR